MYIIFHITYQISRRPREALLARLARGSDPARRSPLARRPLAAGRTLEAVLARRAHGARDLALRLLRLDRLHRRGQAGAGVRRGYSR